MSAAPLRYSAFISYARSDERAARWLQQRIEGYRFPRRMVANGLARLLPVFRDRDELAAGSDLNDALAAALAESQWLIVICTPAAAASKWVSREIEVFTKLRCSAHVLTAWFDGAIDTAFPATLGGPDGHVPLAADFRANGDGRRLGSLKLIATLAGVRLDDLIHRDAARRARRLALVALAAVLLATSMSVLALVAVRARAAAEVQRNKAEGFVEFLLTDLRTRLQAVGKLELLTAVNKQAIAYYDGADLARLPPDSLERRAALLHAMGEDDEKRGDLALATRKWQEARRTTAALLAAVPSDPKRVYAQSQSEYWVGFAAWRAGDLAGAKSAFLSYASLTDRLRRLDPENLNYILEQGYAFSNLGAFTLRPLGQAITAESQFRKSIAAFEIVAKRRPDQATQKDIADGWGWLANALRQQGRYAEARAFRQRQRVWLNSRLARDPSDRDFRARLVANSIGWARIDLAEGRPDQAEAMARSALPDAVLLAKLDPADHDARDALRMVSLVAASAALERGDAGRVRSYTWFCTPRVVPPEELLNEVSVWCLQLRHLAGLQPPVTIPKNLQVGQFSPTWGIDFRSVQRSPLHNTGEIVR